MYDGPGLKVDSSYVPRRITEGSGVRRSLRTFVDKFANSLLVTLYNKLPKSAYERTKCVNGCFLRFRRPGCPAIKRRSGKRETDRSHSFAHCLDGRRAHISPIRVRLSGVVMLHKRLGEQFGMPQDIANGRHAGQVAWVFFFNDPSGNTYSREKVTGG